MFFYLSVLDCKYHKGNSWNGIIHWYIPSSVYSVWNIVGSQKIIVNELMKKGIILKH